MANFITQSFISILSRGVAIVFTFLAGIVIARYLGPSGKGILATFRSIIIILIPLGEFGIRQSTAFYLGSKEHPDKDIHSSMQWLYCVASVLSVVMAMTIYHAMGLIERTSIGVALIFACYIPLFLFESYHNGIFIAGKQIKKINFTATLDKLLLLFFMLILLTIFKLDIVGAALGYTLSKFIAVGFIIYWLFDMYAFNPEFNKVIVLKLLRLGLVYAFAFFVIQMNYRLNIIIMNKLLDSASVGIFSVGVNVAEAMRELPVAIGLVLFSRSVNWKSEERGRALDKVKMLCRIIVVTMLGVSIFFGVISNVLIPMLYGKDFSSSVPVIWILLPGVICISLALTINLFIAGQGKPHLSLYVYIPALIVNVVFNFILIPNAGINGAAFAATFSYFLAAVIYIVIFCREYDSSWRDLLILKRADINVILEKIRKK